MSFQNELDYLEMVQNRKDAFFDAVYNSRKLSLSIDNAGTIYYAHVLLFWNVSLTTYDTSQATPTSFLDGFVSWGRIPVFPVPFYLSVWYSVSNFVVPFLPKDPNYSPAVLTLNLPAAGYTSLEQILSKPTVRGNIDWRFADQQIKHFKPTTQEPEYYPQGTDAEADGAWSEKNWPEMLGLATRTVNNIGVYTPDWLDIDFNLTNTLGFDFVGLYPLRMPTTEAESNQIGWDFLRRLGTYLMFGGGSQGVPRGARGRSEAAQKQFDYITGEFDEGAQQVRLVYPRIRAFNRQREAVMSYYEYSRRLDNIIGGGWKKFNDTEYVTRWNKIIIRIRQDQYDDFVQSLQPYLPGGHLVPIMEEITPEPAQYDGLYQSRPHFYR